MRTRMLAFAAGALLLAACSSSSSSGGSGSTGTTGGTCDPTKGQECPCTDNSQCPEDKGYTCDSDQTKVCIFQCNTGDDCKADYAPDSVKTACTASALGCTCDLDPSSGLSVCSTKGCGTDADCPAAGQVCADGQCVASPTTTVAACAVFPEYQVLNAGQSFTWHVQAYVDANKTKPVHVPDSDVTWSAGSAALTAGTGGTFTAGASGTGAEAAGPTATINGVPCSGTVRVYPAASDFRVTVIDQLAGTPVTGATVVVDGTQLGAATDATGQAHGTVAAGTHTVSVFHANYDYVTIYQTTATDLLIPTTLNSTDKEGGFTGQVKNLFTQNSKIHAGFIGTSIAGSITDLSTSLLVGPSLPASGSVGGKSFSLNLPGGVLIGLNDQIFNNGGNGKYAVYGQAGYCPNHASDGTCGVRSVWGLAGDIDIDKISPIIDQVSGSGGIGTINIGSVLKSILPVLRDFNSIVVRDAQFALSSSQDSAGNSTSLTPLDLDNGLPTGAAATEAVKLGLKLNVKVPALPKLGGTYVDGALVLAAVDVPGRGLIPLGLTAGIDNTGTTDQSVTDGHVQDDNGVQDQVTLNMAPAHGGAEGNGYRMAIVASSFTNITSGLVGSGIVASPAACANGTGGVCYGATINANQQFLGFPEGASFDFGSRTLTLGNSTVTGTQLERIDFQNDSSHRWFVYFDPQAVSSVQIPALPDGITEDRIFTSHGGATSFFLLAFDIGQGSLDHAAKFGDAASGLQKLDKYINRFAIKDYPAPSISITSPTANATISPSTTATVTIAADDQNNNVWRLCFVAGATDHGIATDDLANCAAGNAPTDSSGNATASLPANATGTGFLHAVLINGAGTAVLTPPVEDSVKVTVQ